MVLIPSPISAGLHQQVCHTGLIDRDIVLPPNRRIRAQMLVREERRRLGIARKSTASAALRSCTASARLNSKFASLSHAVE